MKVIDEKLDRLRVRQEPLRLQLVDCRQGRAGQCLCGKDLTGYIGQLCIGGDTLDDPLIVFHKICQSCIEGGPETFIKVLRQFESHWKSASERMGLMAESIEKMPSDDWPELPEGEV